MQKLKYELVKSQNMRLENYINGKHLDDTQPEALLQEFIREQLLIISCETHSKVCALRDENLEKAVMDVYARTLNEEKAISVQSAIALLESDLGDA